MKEDSIDECQEDFTAYDKIASLTKGSEALRQGAEYVQACLNAATDYRTKQGVGLLEVMLEFIKGQVAGTALTIREGRLMGFHLHKWLQINTADDAGNKFQWIVDFAPPGAVPRPLLLMPGSPFQKAYFTE